MINKLEHSVSEHMYPPTRPPIPRRGILCAKFYANQSGKNCRILQKCRYHGNNDSTHTKNNRPLRLPIIHLHAKFEDDRRKTTAARALTRKFPQKMGLPWQRWLRPHQKPMGVFDLP